jgi:hypothetical protein
LLMLRAAFKSAGADRAVAFTLLNRLTVMMTAVITLALVITYLPPDRQGYYFTFTSLLLLQSFLELGMGIVLVQFMSHEWSAMKLVDGDLVGSARSLARVGALVRIGLRWYLLAAVVFALVIGCSGTWLLLRQDAPSDVLLPWWSLCAMVSLSLLLVPLRSFLEGANQVVRVQTNASQIVVCASAAGWIALVAGLDLYSLTVVAGTTAILGLWLYGRAAKPFLRAARRGSGDEGLSWRNEFWPQQWRIALSLMSGFCVFQSFVPILFYVQGAVVAGQMGASLQIYSAVHTLGQAWGNSRAPKFGILGAIGKFAELRAVTKDIAKRGTATAALCAAFALCAVGVLKIMDYKADRFIGLVPLAVLLGTSVLLQRTAVETLVIRFQKAEPFVVNSVVSAVLMLGSNFVNGRYFGPAGVCVGFAVVMTCITAPWTHRIFSAQMARFESQTKS